jgi:hypothetical protein
MKDIEGHPMPRSALLFMAAVEEAKKSNEGAIRAIAPLFWLALEPQRGQILNIEKATATLSPIMGDAFTEHAFEAFLPQLTKLEWLSEERAGNGKSAYLVPATLPSLEKEDAIEASTEKLKRLHRGFVDFLDIHAPLLNLSITPEQFQWQIFRWATSLDGLDKAEVKAEAGKLLAGQKPSIRNAFLDETTSFSRVDKTLSLEFAAYVKWLAKNNRTELADVASLTELGLALEFLEEIQRPSANLSEKITTAFVLDSPVLLDLLGLSGSSRKTSIERCIKALTDRGGKIVTLQHCLEELSDILTTVLDRSPSQRFGLTGDAMRSDPVLVRRAQSIARQPDQAVKVAGVEILRFDRNDPRNENCFPDELIDQFRKSANWHDHYKTTQRDRDALSIGYVMRRRQGKLSSEIFETPFIFVARNSTFTRFSETFVQNNLAAPKYAVGPAIETKTLAAIVWMRFGSSADPDLPQIHLISACDRILATNGNLLRKAEKRIKEIRDDEVAEALMASQQAVMDLVVAVGGSPEVLDAAQPEELLHAFTTSAEARGREAEREKARAVEADLAAKMDATSKEAKALRNKAAILAAEKISQETKRKQAEQEIEMLLLAREERLHSQAGAIMERSNIVAWEIVRLVWVLAAVVSFGGQFFIWRGSDWWTASYVNLALGIIVLICTAVTVAFGIRFISPGKHDLAATLQSLISAASTRYHLNRLPLVEDRNELQDELERRGAL